jgi:hypothetical protein
MLHKMYLVTAEAYHPRLLPQREEASAPTPLATNNATQSSTPTLSGLRCALSISVMHQLRRLLII